MQWESTTYTYGRVRQPPELCHYGVKGQKWGLRRYQYENGSYTPEGKERYRKSSGSSENRSEKNRGPARGIGNSNVKKGSAKKGHPDWKPEDAENLSDEELNRRNSRMQREQQYKDSTTPKWKKEAKQTAKDWMKEALKKIFIGTAVTLAVVAMRNQYSKAFDKISQYSKRKLSELRQPKATKDWIQRAANDYGLGGSKARDVRLRNERMDRFDRARSRG